MRFIAAEPAIETSFTKIERERLGLTLIYPLPQKITRHEDANGTIATKWARLMLRHLS